MRNRNFLLSIIIISLIPILSCQLDKQSAQIKRIESPVKAAPPARPTGPYYYYMESQLYRNQGKLDEAIQYLQMAIDKDDTSDFLKEELALLYFQQKQSEKALSIVQALLAKDPENVELLEFYGRIKQSLKQIDDAKAAYEKVIQYEPENENPYLILGRLYYEAKDYKNAFRVYSQLVNNIPASYVGHFYLGKLYAEQGKYEDAEAGFLKTLELQPDLEEPRTELVEIYKKSAARNKKLLRCTRTSWKEIPTIRAPASSWGITIIRKVMLPQPQRF